MTQANAKPGWRRGSASSSLGCRSSMPSFPWLWAPRVSRYGFMIPALPHQDKKVVFILWGVKLCAPSVVAPFSCRIVRTMMEKESDAIFVPGTNCQSGPQAGMRVLSFVAFSPSCFRSFSQTLAQFLRCKPHACATMGMGRRRLCFAWFVFVKCSVCFGEAKHSVVVFVFICVWVARRWNGVVGSRFCGDSDGVRMSEAGANAISDESGHYTFPNWF